MQIICARYKQQGCSNQAASLIVDSWRPHTRAVYNTYITKWKLYAAKNAIPHDKSDIAQTANFLADLYSNGASYSAINAARSALSAYLPLIDGHTVGSHPTICKLVKGVFENRPALPKYTDTWDVNTVLEYLERFVPLEKLTLKELTLKTCMLLALVTGQRGHALYSLKLTDVKMYSKKCVLLFSSLLKTTRPGVHNEPAEITALDENETLCPVKHLEQYIQKTRTLRGETQQVFISHSKPHAPVGKQTWSRWIKQTLSGAGIDVTRYTAHSTRAASCSAAAKMGLPLKTIMRAAGWTNAKTFTKFYKRENSSATCFSQKVLDGYVHCK